MIEPLYLLFLVIWLIWCAGSSIFLFSRTPPWRKYWYPRVVVAGSAIPAALFGVPAFLQGGLNAAIGIAVFVAMITYFALAFVRVCDNCGKFIQPTSLDDPPKDCPRCGTRLFRANFSDPKPHT